MLDKFYWYGIRRKLPKINTYTHKHVFDFLLPMPVIIVKRKKNKQNFKYSSATVTVDICVLFQWVCCCLTCVLLYICTEICPFML